MTGKDLLLYAVTDRSWLGTETLVEQVEKSLQGGATFIQLREKELDEEAFLREAIAIRELCTRYGVPFVINDNVRIALACNADGVHVGQEDMDAGHVRELLGPDKIIGVSTHSVEEALLAQAKGADYLGAGAMFPTGTKAEATRLSLEILRAITEAVDIPVVAIGGIGPQNVSLLQGSGVDGIAVVSAVFGCPDIRSATAELRQLTEEVLG